MTPGGAPGPAPAEPGETAEPGERGEPGERNPWPILGVLTIGLFMTLLDLTIVNIAFPSVVTDLGATLDEGLWVFSAYILVFATLLILGGRLGDTFGPRRVYLVGLVVFVLASLACGLADDAAVLIAARAVQGLGGALIAPQLLPITAAVFPPSKWGAAFGLSAALSGLAILAGPTLGGVIVNYLSWRWIFLINLPVGLLTLVLVLRVVPDLRPGRRQSFGLGSTALLIAGLGACCFALIEGERLEWSPLVWILLAAGLALTALFGLQQRRSQGRGALVPFELFRSRNFASMTAVLAVTGFGMLGAFLPLTVYLQAILQMSPLRAGLTIAAMPLTSTLVAGVAGRLADRYGGRRFLLAGLASFLAGIVLLGAVSTPDATTWQLVGPLALMGLGTGLIFAPLFAVAFTDLDPGLSGAASGVINTAQELGGLIATAVVGAILQARLVAGMRAWVDEQALAVPEEGREEFRAAFDPLLGGGVDLTTSGPAAVPEGTDPEQVQATTAAFADAFVSAMREAYAAPVLVLLVGIAVVLFVRLTPSPAGPPSGPGDRPGTAPPTSPRRDQERTAVQQSNPHGTTVLGLYQIAPGKEDEILAAIHRHWPTLDRHGLVTGPPARVYVGDWGEGRFALEIATWRSDEALHSAFSQPEITAIWQEIKELTVDRNGRDGVEYPAVTALPAFADLPEERHDAAYATGVAVHQIRPEHVDSMRELLAEEYEVLLAEGFVPRQRPQAYLGKDKHGPFSVSVVDWYEPTGPGKAFMNADVNALWRRTQAYTTGRAGRPASEYLWADRVDSVDDAENAEHVEDENAATD
ncbi:MFS transporter [Streptomyces bohaiensis]|uniref:MFS transporter n=2 Tax=Streptomyces bohaiensis TaxID=1431344 RepID=A0ABX1CHK8_9ACTN|nr:MFS transporter [Streptomyces bohaiensis]NJQ15949.1 MFS transporter [Streptomyces bohaiensis]